MLMSTWLAVLLVTVVFGQEETVVWLSDTAWVRGDLSFLIDDPRPIYVFKGVPYAQPPTGSRRFLPPQPAQLWIGERAATRYGDRCHQSRDYTNMSEDCLFLNIHTPSLDASRDLAVIVNIHGGGLVTGSGNRDATALTHMNDVIFVTMNYRLGPLGFFTTGDASAAGNVGQLDQQAAIRWVSQNIGRFGGDPDRITIMGDSGGAVSVSVQVLSATNAGLFARAITNSGVSTAVARVNTREEEVDKSALVALAVGCSSSDSETLVACMLDVDADDLTRHGSGVTLYPYVDGTYITDLPFNAYNTGRFNRVQYLLGFNRDEGLSFFSGAEPNELNIRELIDSYLFRFYPENTEAIMNAVMNMYADFDNFDSDDDYARAYSDFIGDLRYIGPTNDVARKHSVYNDTYMFLFDHRPLSSTSPAWATARHSQQRPYVMGFPFSNPLGGPYSDDGVQLSEDMMKYYTNFAKTGDPNGGDLPRWPRVNCNNKEYMRLVHQPTAGQNFAPQRMALWSDVIPELDTYRSSSYEGFPWNCPP